MFFFTILEETEVSTLHYSKDRFFFIIFIFSTLQPISHLFIYLMIESTQTWLDKCWKQSGIWLWFLKAARSKTLNINLLPVTGRSLGFSLQLTPVIKSAQTSTSTSGEEADFSGKGGSCWCVRATTADPGLAPINYSISRLNVVSLGRSGPTHRAFLLIDTDAKK